MVVIINCYIGCEDEVTTWYYSTQLIEVVNAYDLVLFLTFSALVAKPKKRLSHIN